MLVGAEVKEQQNTVGAKNAAEAGCWILHYVRSVGHWTASFSLLVFLVSKRPNGKSAPFLAYNKRHVAELCYLLRGLVGDLLKRRL